MNIFLILTFALILDAVIGDPKWLWTRIAHPVQLIGKIIAKLDAMFNTTPFTCAKGVLVLVLLIGVGGALGWGASLLPAIFHIPIIAVLLAQKSLITHIHAVALKLSEGLEAARIEVGKIVGRETAQMDQTAICRAAIESGAENLSDGVIAPALWYLFGGLPGLFIYKFVNTADSMIGYKNPRYLAFGWAVARFDDLLNWGPARLCAALLTAAFQFSINWRQLTENARKHRSPNAGWPEAAMAFGLGVALSGPRTYDQKTTQDPYVNPKAPHPTLDDIKSAVEALWRSWAIFLLLSVFIGAFWLFLTFDSVRF